MDNAMTGTQAGRAAPEGIRIVLLRRVEAACRHYKLSEWQFGTQAVGNGRFVERLRQGAGSLATLERAERYLDFLALESAEGALRGGGLSHAAKVAASAD